MKTGNHIHKIKCHSCGREFDATDRLKYFGKPSTLLYHVCIECREKLEKEKRKAFMTSFGTLKTEREILAKKPVASYNCAKSKARMKGCDILAEREMQKKIDDEIGL